MSRDKFFLVIGANDPKFSETETRRLLEEIGGTHIELVEDETDALFHLHHFDCRWRARPCVGIAGFRGGLSRKPPIEIFPDMNRQLKLRPAQPNDFFPNGLSSQLPPPGTIARSEPIQTVNGPGLSL